MCKKYIYLRVSTDKQGFEQQMQDIKAYGINPNEVDGIVEEHESGGKSYVDRKFQALLTMCEKGDVIYAASTDRVGRSFCDMIKLMADAKRRGITIVACKQNLKLDDDSLTTRILISIMTLIDEDERERIRHRTKNKLDWKKQQIAEHGYYIVEKGPNAGMIKTKLGRDKGCDISKAVEASCEARLAKKLAWRESSVAFQWVIDRLKDGKSRKEVITEFNKLHELQPDVFCTPRGAKLSAGVLSYWLKDSGLSL